MKYTVAIGNAFDGITLHEIFDDHESAMIWAEKLAKKDYTEYNIVEICQSE